jgi:hypothetical protein
MINGSLIIAVALIGSLWVAVAVALALSTRRNGPAESAPARLAAKSAPWRAQPDNRVLPSLPTCRGPANDSTAGDFGGFKDLLA